MKIGFTPSNLCNSFINSDVKYEPLSLNISLGMPTRENITSRPSATDIVSNDFSGIASGYPVAKSMQVRIYLYPLEDGGDIGPTISIAQRANTSVTTGKGIRGAGLTRPLDDMRWHLSHDLQNAEISIDMPGQKNRALIFSRVLRTEKCPDKVDS